MARPEGTVDVPRCRRDVALSRLGLVCLLWLVTWRLSIVRFVVGVVSMRRGGGGQSTRRALRSTDGDVALSRRYRCRW
jgi:hypothetical protein